jgi:hypothetical protein
MPGRNTAQGQLAQGQDPNTFFSVSAYFSYLDTPPLPGVLYWYRICGYSTSVRGPYVYSSPAASILPAPQPSAPTATPSFGANQVAWALPIGFYGTLTASLYRSITSGAETLLVSGLTGSSYADHGLQNGVTYFYKLAFANEGGTGPQSVEFTGTPSAGLGFTQGVLPSGAFTQMPGPASAITQSASPNTPATQGMAPNTPIRPT